MNSNNGVRHGQPGRRLGLWAVVALLLIAGLWFGRSLWAGKKEPEYTTVTVERGDVVAKVTATGTVSALVTVQVGSQVSGRIQELHADFNSQVKKGQLIAKIDPRLFLAELEQQQANVQAAQANLTRSKVQAQDARRQARRADELSPRGLISQSERDTAQATAEAAEATVVSSQASLAQARAALNRAQVNLNYTDIISPTDGVVISRSVDVGQTVAASLQAPVLFTIAQDLRQMQVDTSVAESDVGKLAAGMKANFTVDAYPGERFRGEVRQVRDAATTTQNVVTYDAVLDVKNEELKLKPGMTANVTFVYARREAVLKVPNAALRFRMPNTGKDKAKDSKAAGQDKSGSQGQPQGERPAQGAQAGGEGAGGGGNGERRRRNRGEDGNPGAPRTVYVLREGKALPVEIKTGISDGSNTEVVEGGLVEGDELITDMPGAEDDKPRAAAPGMRMF
ncbi:efflux RND transporter periplasmic adaptor subunit [Solimonas sp. K1W22B-7]|uniref:efflux RND transporter periplasmic adaptor subunit n=1 Tax=Solimonas sp. K1W22B-7 TaxID=2303331 RepID=UPI000E330ACD|nr:efflux RND transporter periplasmic adaptor subunit [Solimonas sp. K1W22B-7]AXQ29334.1 efflux RND transporter periplasmic adaptor subunit [Solimonas sp. K1W22B-7]